MITIFDMSVGFGVMLFGLYSLDYIIGLISQWIFGPVVRKKKEEDHQLKEGVVGSGRFQ